MDEEGFNFYRLHTAEKNVALPALKELFEILWDKKYPEIPWGKDAESVKQFEQKKNEIPQQRKKREKTIPPDSNRLNYDWDINKVVEALVDSRLFDLTTADVNGMPVSDHIVKIRDIRNEIAHFTQSACSTEKFDTIVQSMTSHIKAFELTNFDASHYIGKLHIIKSQERPIVQEVKDERIKRDSYVEKQREDKTTFFDEYKRLDREKDFLKETIDSLKVVQSAKNKAANEESVEQRAKEHSHRQSSTKKYETLNSDYTHLKMLTDDINDKGSVELEEIKSENKYLKQILDETYEKHSAEVGRLNSEKGSLEEILKHNVELMKLKMAIANMEKAHSEEIERLTTENDSLKQTVYELRGVINKYDQNQLGMQNSPYIYQVLVCYHVCILIVITFLPTVKTQAVR